MTVRCQLQRSLGGGSIEVSLPLVEKERKAEETAHTIGEQIGDEAAWCETMCGEPRPECGVGEAQAKDTEAEEEMT
jgi:hypothetical protein